MGKPIEELTTAQLEQALARKIRQQQQQLDRLRREHARVVARLTKIDAELAQLDALDQLAARSEQRAAPPAPETRWSAPRRAPAEDVQAAAHAVFNGRMLSHMEVLKALRDQSRFAGLTVKDVADAVDALIVAGQAVFIGHGLYAAASVDAGNAALTPTAGPLPA